MKYNKIARKINKFKTLSKMKHKADLNNFTIDDLDEDQQKVFKTLEKYNLDRNDIFDIVFSDEWIIYDGNLIDTAKEIVEYEGADVFGEIIKDCIDYNKLIKYLTSDKGYYKGDDIVIRLI